MSLVRFLEVPLKAPNPLLVTRSGFFYFIGRGKFTFLRIGEIKKPLPKAGGFGIFRRGNNGKTTPITIGGVNPGEKNEV